jgi:hypothetical protein
MSCGGRLGILWPVNIADETVNAGTFIRQLVEIALKVRTH